MKIFVSGAGWVTPLGTRLDSVWERLIAGERPAVGEIANPFSGEVFHYYPVPLKWVDHVARERRIRRSSAITYFMAAAGLSAISDAGLKVTQDLSGRIAVVSAVSSGGVIYTRRFYQQIVDEGANAASPLLFPETVYNAPASHLAAILGLNGMNYTLVGDGSVGLAGLNFGSQLLQIYPDLEHVIVVGAEEIDWILCAAYHDWRLTSCSGTISLHATPPGGTVLGEGAGAVLLSREGKFRLECSHDGVPFFRRDSARDALLRVLSDLIPVGPVDLAICSANGTFIDAAESEAIESAFGPMPVFCGKTFFGESIGASALLQVVLGAMALRKASVPGLELKSAPSRVVVSAIGLNQQAAAAILST
jgi:3-oxoacyl-(acyl-carrier-protein) synthase